MRGIVGRGADARFDPTSRADSAEGLVGLLGGLVDEGLVDVGDHTTTGDGRLDEGVELLVTTDGELKVAGGDALDLSRFGVDVTRQRLHRTMRDDEWWGSSVLEGRMRLDATRLSAAVPGWNFKSGCRLFKRL